MLYKGYKVIEGKGFIIIEGIMDFDPVHTFECGQCFRWQQEADGSYSGIVGRHAVNVSYNNSLLKITNAAIEDFNDTWHEYFDLGRDYSAIKKALMKDEIMEKAIVSGHGIRILKQNFWETLISFIISANNRIPMIKKVVASIAKDYGDEIIFDGKKYYTFPDAERLSCTCLEELGACKGGFRCKYMLNTAKMIMEGSLNIDNLKLLSLEEARSSLVKLPGVGNKVADCTLLFSGTKYDVFPTDVWVKRVMEELYFKKESSFKEIQAFARTYFNDLAGFAQQYLFYYARENRIGVK